MTLVSCRNNEYKSVITQYNIDSFINHTLRDSVLDLANIEINNWISDSVTDAKILVKRTWVVDSFLIFNSNNTKAIGSILISETFESSEYQLDNIHYLLCEKRNSKWCFFLGATYYWPREFTTKDITKPASIAQLAQLARKQLLLTSYIRPNILPWSKKLIVNEHIFDYGQMGNYGTEQQKDEWIDKVRR